MSTELAALKQNLQKRVTLPPDALTSILSRFSRLHAPKGTVLLAHGTACNYLYYVASGACKSYVISAAGKKRVVMFALPDWWITDIDTFTRGGRSKINICVVQDAVVYRIAKGDLEALMQQYASLESAFRYMMQYAYIREQNRAVELITDTALMRYEQVIAAFPQLEQTLSQKDIASFLGITPEFLSAMKRSRRREAKS